MSQLLGRINKTKAMLGARVLGRVGEREEGAGHFQGGLQSKYKEVFFLSSARYYLH